MEQTQSDTAPQKEKKSIYDASYSSIFARNFLAGFSKAVGGIFVYLLLGGLIYYLALTYILPNLKDGPPSSQQPSGYTIDPQKLEGALEYMQKNQQPQPQPEKTTP